MRQLQKLDSLIGNERLVHLFRAAPRPPQSTLFSGPEGIGKKTLALLLAKLQLCQEPTDQDVCGRCRSCLKAEKGNHPDIRLIEPEGLSIKIETTRELNREAQYRPFEGRSRFFIVDDAEKMTAEAANSILKTLEEPPVTSHLMLISAFPDRLLPTIRSRCQIFTFCRMNRKAIEQYLRNDVRLDHPELRAAFGQGSLGKALSLDLDEICSKRDRLLSLFQEWLLDQSFAVVFKWCDQKEMRSLVRQREEVRSLLELLQSICYDLYYVLVETRERIVSLDRVADLEKLARRIDIQSLRDYLNAISNAKRDIDRNVSPSICFQTLWLDYLRSKADAVY